MPTNMKKRLQEIKYEVKEFHPFLSALFENMDKIDCVDYTHGQSEFGADFVLHTMDELLNEKKYI